MKVVIHVSLNLWFFLHSCSWQRWDQEWNHSRWLRAFVSCLQEPFRIELGTCVILEGSACIFQPSCFSCGYVGELIAYLIKVVIHISLNTSTLALFLLRTAVGSGMTTLALGGSSSPRTDTMQVGVTEVSVRYQRIIYGSLHFSKLAAFACGFVAELDVLFSEHGATTRIHQTFNSSNYYCSGQLWDQEWNHSRWVGAYIRKRGSQIESGVTYLYNINNGSIFLAVLWENCRTDECCGSCPSASILFFILALGSSEIWTITLALGVSFYSRKGGGSRLSWG